MVKQYNLFIALLGTMVLGVFSSVQAGEKHEHTKGPNGGDVLEVGDNEHHHVEFVHDAKVGKLTVYFFLTDLRTTFKVKEAPKLNLKTKAGPKQLEMKGDEGWKFEATDDALKEQPEGRIVVVLGDGKKYNVNLDPHAGHNHK